MKRKSILQGSSICATIVLVILTSGCLGPKVRNYSGDNLQKSEVAVVKGFYYFTPFAYISIDIYRVDDSRPEATNVVVLPGWHELGIRSWSISFLPFGMNAPPECARVALNFEAGHEYKILIRGVAKENVEIKDVTTGVTILSKPWEACEQTGQVYFSACIHPLSQGHNTWSTDEVNTIREVIATAAQRHALEQKKTKERGYIAWYTLPRKFFDSSGKEFELKAHYTNPPVPRVPCGWTLNTKNQTGTIFVGLTYLSGGQIITYLEREEVESVWKEVYEPLQNKFGERVTPLRIP
jgi:hypothetical protein